MKTTRASVFNPFYLTRNELQVSQRECDRYWLYRLHEFGYRNRLYQLSGSLSESCDLAPQLYTAKPLGRTFGAALSETVAHGVVSKLPVSPKGNSVISTLLHERGHYFGGLRKLALETLYE